MLEMNQNPILHHHSPVKTPDDDHMSGNFSISSETGLLKPFNSDFEGQARAETLKEFKLRTQKVHFVIAERNKRNDSQVLESLESPVFQMAADGIEEITQINNTE